MSTINWSHVSFMTKDDLLLHGLELDAAPSACTVVYVHGKCGNNYENAFIQDFAAAVSDRGIGFLTFNNRGAGCIIEGYRAGQLVYFGGSLERFDESLLDIDAAIRHVRTYSNKIVLAGHSHGCEKIYNYVRQGGDAAALALLSPADSYRLQSEWLNGVESVNEQLERLRTVPRSEAMKLLPLDQFGIRADWIRYPIPVTRETLIDWLTCDGFELFHSKADRESVIELPTFCYLGGRDPLQGQFIGAMRDQLQDSFKDLTLHFELDGDHQMRSVAPRV